MRIGMITIGQSPRNDVVKEIRDILGPVEIVERGCLDELTKEQIESLKPKEREPFIVTLLRDGSSVRVSREKVTNLLQKRIHELERNVDLIVLLCTGDFANLKSKKLTIEPGKLIRELSVRGMIAEENRLGIIIPSAEQVEQTKKKWGDVNLVVAVASPYQNQEKLQEASRTLQAKNVHLTVLDCIGYTRQMKRKVKEIIGSPVILARTVVARVTRELY